MVPPAIDTVAIRSVAPTTESQLPRELAERTEMDPASLAFPVQEKEATLPHEAKSEIGSDEPSLLNAAVNKALRDQTPQKTKNEAASPTKTVLRIEIFSPNRNREGLMLPMEVTPNRQNKH